MTNHIFIAIYNLEGLTEDMTDVLDTTKRLRDLYNDVRFEFDETKCTITFDYRGITIRKEES